MSTSNDHLEGMPCRPDLTKRTILKVTLRTPIAIEVMSISKMTLQVTPIIL